MKAQQTNQERIVESPQSIDSLPQITSLIHYQSTFIEVLHTNVLLSNQQLSQSLMRFQIQWIANANDKLNIAIKTLSNLLIAQKMNYDFILRDSFHKVLGCDYLPLLRFSRHEITQLSLYGFDIYVQPLQALLQIVNRINHAEDDLTKCSDNLIKNCKKQALDNLQLGYEQYMTFVNMWRISFNVYILKEYLKISTKSLLKKQKEIVFTGCSNLFHKLVSRLTTCNAIGLLVELGDLNNQLYNFHQSYDILKFYTLLLPICDQYQPIFNCLKPIAAKCTETYILTPFLFGLIRNYQDIQKWVNQVQTPIWSDYVVGLLNGLMINIKARILDYEQITNLLRVVMNKIGLLNIQIDGKILQNLQPQWKQAKQFFISALKFGYSVGSLQTWHICQAQQIQTTVFRFVVDGLLLLKDPKSCTLLGELLAQPRQWAMDHIAMIPQEKINLNSYMSGYCKIDLSKIKNQHPLLWLIRMVNLVLIDEELSTNEFVVYNLTEQLVTLDCPNSGLLKQRLNDLINVVVGFMIKISESKKTSVRNIKLTQQFYEKFKPLQLVLPLTNLILNAFSVKDAVNTVNTIITHHYQTLPTQILVTIISKYICSENTQDQRLINVRTFHKQFTVHAKYFHLYQKQRSFISTLLDLISTHPNTISFAKQLIKALIKASPRLCLPILMSPKGDINIETFSSWLLFRPQHHQLLLQIVTRGINVVHTSQGQDYILTITVPSLCQNILSHINSLMGCIQTYEYLLLLENLYALKNALPKDYQEILNSYQNLIPLFVINPNPQKYQKLQNSLTAYSRILSNHLIVSQQQWEKQYSSFIRYNIVCSGQRQKTTENQHINHLKSTFCMFQHDQIQEQLQIPNIDPKICQKALQQQTLNCPSEEIPKWFKPIPLKNFVRVDDWKNIVILSKKLLIPQIPRTIIFQLLNKNIQKNIHIHTLLMLNPFNLLQCLIWAIKNHNINLLQLIGFIKLLNNQIDVFYNFISEMQSQQKLQVIKYMTSHLNSQQLDIIASSYKLTPQHIPIYNQCVGLEFLVVRNQANWRLIVDNIVMKLTQSNISSIMLQYEEYLQITNCINSQYNKEIISYENSLNIYESHLKIKSQILLMQDQNQQCQQNDIKIQQRRLRIVSEIAHAKVLISAGKAKQILPRLGKLNLMLNHRNFDQYNNIVTIYHNILKHLNNLVEGNILIPDFISSKSYQNSQLVQHYEFNLGYYLEQYDEINTNHQHFTSYTPQKQIKTQLNQEIWTDLSNLLLNNKIIKIEQNVLGFILQSDSIRPTLQIINQQKKEQQKEQDQQQSRETEQIQQSKEYDHQMENIKKLGKLYTSRKQKLSVDPILQACLKRQKLSWQILKQSYSQQYHQIKSILMNQQINSQNVYLKMKGKLLKINTNNKLECCNKIGLSCLGSKTMKLITYFIQGALSNE